MLNILMIGDIVARPGRRAVKELLPKIKREYQPHMIIANGENAAGGNGITKEIAFELFSYGVDVITMGNHVWDKKEILDFIDSEERIIRPANYPEGTPGKGAFVFIINNHFKIGVINLSGRVFLSDLNCPFRKADQLINEIHKQTNIIIIDFHAETTSEKMAFGWYVDGRVTAVCGTHTHIQTADERILPGGTAYITDVGMTGPRDSVLGVKKEIVINKFLTQMPQRFDIASGIAQLNAVAIKINERNGQAVEIKRIYEFV